jgi:hypothetical protein
MAFLGQHASQKTLSNQWFEIWYTRCLISAGERGSTKHEITDNIDSIFGDGNLPGGFVSGNGSGSEPGRTGAVQWVAEISIDRAAG